MASRAIRTSPLCCDRRKETEAATSPLQTWPPRQRVGGPLWSPTLSLSPRTAASAMFYCTARSGTARRVRDASRGARRPVVTEGPGRCLTSQRRFRRFLSHASPAPLPRPTPPRVLVNSSSRSQPPVVRPLLVEVMLAAAQPEEGRRLLSWAGRRRTRTTPELRAVWPLRCPFWSLNCCQRRQRILLFLSARPLSRCRR